jgi:nicotinate-nucleotide pyrophosphorylase (carboxylating)
MNMNDIDRLITASLNEDLPSRDLTTDLTIEKGTQATGAFLSKQDLVLAGLFLLPRIFDALDRGAVQVVFHFEDGNAVPKQTKIASLTGCAQCILTGERLALNFLQRLSGIASLTREFLSEMPKRSPVKILDTRKTTPGLRHLEKYAVRIAGGTNHRETLSSGIMIKDNHIRLGGGITTCVQKAKKLRPLLTEIEVEVKTLEELNEVLSLGVDVVMLDNMDIPMMEEATSRIRKNSPNTKIEVSGNVTKERLKDLAQLDIDFISSGSITHSATAVDISLDVFANVALRA